MNNNFLSLLSRLTTVRIDKFADSGMLAATDDDRIPASILDGANCVSSRVDAAGSPRHAIILDLDIPAYLVPSSTPGHSHLYIDTTTSEEAYFKLLDALADAGVIESGYATASKNKGGTHLRLPWVKKGDESKVAVAAKAAPKVEPF